MVEKHDDSIKAFDQTITAKPGKPVCFPLRFDYAGSSFFSVYRIEVLSRPANGKLVIDGTKATYVADSGASDSFTWRVVDLTGRVSNEATVSIRIDSNDGSGSLNPGAIDDNSIVGMDATIFFF